MRRQIITILLALMALTVAAQELPQFDSHNFDGWEYNNPGVQLNTANIGQGRIVLYVNSKKKALMLTSPEFSCQGMDSISASVLWYTSTFQSSDFDLSLTALTMAIDDSTGQPLDSVTCVPTVLGSRHDLVLCVAVPQGLETCRVRFVSWTGNLVSSGAIKQAYFTAVEATSHEDALLGDLDGDGIVNIGDVTELIDALLLGKAGNIDLAIGDIDGDGNINIADVTALIDLIVSGNANPQP